MRAVVFHEHGSVSKLALEEFPDPVAGPMDAILRVKATSLNGFDPMILAGTTGLKTPLPMIPCGDIAGEITQLGAEVVSGEWKIGDRVCPHPFVLGEGMTGETRLGAACELVRIPARNLIRIPDGVSEIDAASLPIAYGTAYRMMLTRGRIQPGEKVLILGATGGVGTCCLQIAKTTGAEVVVTGSAAWKLEKLRELGADHAIDESKQDFVQAVHDLFGKPRLFGGGGVDVIVNYIGGETWARALRCLASHGRMLTCGATAGFEPPTDIRYIWSFEQQVIGSNGWMPDEQVALLEMVAEGRIRPVLHAVRPLEETPRSIQELIDRQVVGKTVITTT
ncbi:MAG: zinc-binding dehydrogenase [Deltaproteobacteria bacterium]|nr:zinc-binding dehydrogenase [Deltaproteobacteria bacterium]